MDFVKKKKEAALATRVAGFGDIANVPAKPVVVSHVDPINSEETFNANKNFLAAFESFIDKESDDKTSEEKQRQELIEKQLRTIKGKSKDSSKLSGSSTSPKKSKHKEDKKSRNSEKKEKKKEKEREKEAREREKEAKAQAEKEKEKEREKPGVETEKTPKKLKSWRDDKDSPDPKKSFLKRQQDEAKQGETSKDKTADNAGDKGDSNTKKYCVVAAMKERLMEDTQKSVEKKKALDFEEVEVKEKKSEEKVVKEKEVPEEKPSVEEPEAKKEGAQKPAAPVADKAPEAPAVEKTSTPVPQVAPDPAPATPVKGDADFENMGYVSGDDADEYIDHFAKAGSNYDDKPVPAPKPVKAMASEEEPAGSSPVVVNSNQESQRPKTPVLLSRNVADIEAGKEAPAKEDAEKPEKPVEKEEEKVVPVEDSETKAPCSPSVEDELNALKAVGSTEKSEETATEQQQQPPLETELSTCMQQTSNTMQSYNPQVDQQQQQQSGSKSMEQTALYDTKQQQQQQQQMVVGAEMGPSLGVYTPDSATNSVHSIHGGFSNSGEVNEGGSVHNVMESPNSISSVDMNTGAMANNPSTSAHNTTSSSIDSSVGTPQPHMTQQHTTPQHQTNYDHQQQHMQQQHHQPQQQIPCASPQMTAQSPHPQSLPSQSPHSNHNMTSPHPQPSPHAASNHSQQSSPHPLTIPPAANSPYTPVPQPSPGTPANTPNPASQGSSGSARTPTRSPQQHTAAANHQHLQNMQRFYGNYSSPMHAAASAMGMATQGAASGHINHHGNFQGMPPMFPPAHGMFPGLPGMQQGSQKRSEPQMPANPSGSRSGSSTPSATATQGSYYGNQAPATTSAPTAQCQNRHSGSLAKLQQLTNGLEHIPGLPPGPAMQHHLQTAAAAANRSHGTSSKQAAAINAHNALLQGSYPGYPPHQVRPHGPHPAAPHSAASGHAARNHGRHHPPPPMNPNLMQQYSQNTMLQNYAAAQYGLMQQFPMNMHHYHAAAASADHQRSSAGTPHPQANPHMYPGYPGYPLNYR